MVQRTLNPKRISLSIKKSLNKNTDELARRLSTSKKTNVRGPNKWAFLHIGWIGPSFRHRLGIVKVVFVCGLRFVEIADWHLQAFSGRQKQTNAVRASFIAKPPSFYNIFWKQTPPIACVFHGAVGRSFVAKPPSFYNVFWRLTPAPTLFFVF